MGSECHAGSRVVSEQCLHRSGRFWSALGLSTVQSSGEDRLHWTGLCELQTGLNQFSPVHSD